MRSPLAILVVGAVIALTPSIAEAQCDLCKLFEEPLRVECAPDEDGFADCWNNAGKDYCINGTEMCPPSEDAWALALDGTVLFSPDATPLASGLAHSDMPGLFVNRFGTIESRTCAGIVVARQVTAAEGARIRARTSAFALSRVRSKE